ncbi:MAG: family 1 extracellular solute-binding protein [Paenibacillaceae bacterium]|jgi:multiple sugar transport system substrate-binding protein|nr:family 1 extracellular solute-binding protein [Paenibacillaceae bacterium]
MRSFKWGMLVALCSALVLSACGNQAGNGAQSSNTAAGGDKKETAQPQEKAKAPDPVTLTFLHDNTLPDSDFQFIQEMVKKRYPYITLERVKPADGSSGATALKTLVPTGQIPDIFTNAVGGIQYVLDLGIKQPLEDFVKSEKFDLGVYAPGIIEGLKAYGPNKELLGLPYAVLNAALYYNKDIFDKFGVPYPKDGMTWDDATELARRLTRTEAGVNYQGLDLSESNVTTFNQLSLPFIDPKTGKPVFTSNDGWKTYFTTIKTITKIPNSGFTKDNVWNSEMTTFAKDKRLAMIVTPLLSQIKQSGVNWDVVTMPVFASAPKKGIQFTGSLAELSNVGKHKEDAFRVIALLSSPDYQKFIAQAEGQIPVLKDPAVQEVFSQGFPGKHLQSIFKLEYATTLSVTPDDLLARQSINTLSRDFLVDDTDVNTFLRKLQEDVEGKIAAQGKK